ncbi:MAG: hypothetical protein CVU87_00215 [Firmicutes bacterium HGW-Firmicutes-12]|nr:MAG: hypothetical protein CVU87_00215 [Firmicutes bacterium HGW-Firmicutes-12]
MEKEIFSVADICAMKSLENFSPKLIETTVIKRMKELKIDTAKQYEEILERSGEESVLFLALLNNGYSEFFREPFAFALLESRVLPDIFNSKKDSREIRMWSVGCSAGQEPYSILMLAREVSELFKSKMRLHMYATDISNQALDRARYGIYNRNELKKVPLGYLDDHFDQTGNAYRIAPDIKNSVDFLYYDILDQNTVSPPESIYGHFDLIICSNLLIYYNDKAQRFIINKLIKALSPGGYLVVGEAEKAILSKQMGITAVVKSGPVSKKTIV